MIINLANFGHLFNVTWSIFAHFKINILHFDPNWAIYHSSWLKKMHIHVFGWIHNYHRAGQNSPNIIFNRTFTFGISLRQNWECLSNIHDFPAFL